MSSSCSLVTGTLTPPCKWARPEGGTFTAGGQCPFSTGALDSLLDFVGSAGIELLFDLNELVGRNFTYMTSMPNPMEPGETLSITVQTTGEAEIARMAMSPDDMTYDLVMLVVLAVVFRLVALLVLYMRLWLAILQQRRSQSRILKLKSGSV